MPIAPRLGGLELGGGARFSTVGPVRYAHTNPERLSRNCHFKTHSEREKSSESVSSHKQTDKQNNKKKNGDRRCPTAQGQTKMRTREKLSLIKYLHKTNHLSSSFITRLSRCEAPLYGGLVLCVCYFFSHLHSLFSSLLFRRVILSVRVSFLSCSFLLSRLLQLLLLLPFYSLVLRAKASSCRLCRKSVAVRGGLKKNHFHLASAPAASKDLL